MDQSLPSRCPGPPHNPGVLNLIEGKRRWSSRTMPEDARQGFRGWHERGYLPHRDEPGLTQFVTFHLADSYPEALRSEWEHLLQIEDDRERRAELEGYLDRDQGGCHLRRSEISRLVENSLRWFHGDRYDLRAWCIMGNHVHVLFMVGEVPLSEIIESWKKHTSIKSNRLLNRKGAFWAPGYFDTYMRDAEHEQTTIRYIENNPTKSKLVLDPKGWPWSSARFRNEFGALKL